jgi:steroid 5-alpha reductase family enzyme
MSPLLLTFLLRFVSGVPMLEKKFQGHPDWQAYKQRTAAFVPLVKFL